MMKILKIEKINDEFIKYDLEMKKNHNFFANGVLVHNSSLTVYVDGETSGVCSRNLDLQQTDDNLFWKTAIKNDLINAIKSTGRNLAMQSEMVGFGIQGNPENLSDVDSYVFDIFDIDTYSYLGPAERTAIIKQMNDNGFINVKQVPILGIFTLDKNVSQLLEMADGESLNAKNREGVVWKRIDGQFSFKAISNWYLETYPNR